MQITFNLPVTFRSRVGRKINKRTVVGYVPVRYDVPELSNKEVPVVLSFDKIDESGHSSKVAYRGYENRLYQDIGRSAAPEFSSTIEGSELIKYTIKSYKGNYFDEDGFFNEAIEPIMKLFSSIRANGNYVDIEPEKCRNFVQHYLSSFKFEPINDINVRDDVTDQIDDQIKKFKKYISRFLIIDGLIYSAKAEPIISLKPLLPTDIFICTAQPAPDISGKNRYGGDVGKIESIVNLRMPEFQNLALILDELSEDASIIEKVRNVKVFDPEYFKADVDHISLIDLGNSLRSYFLYKLSRLHEDKKNNSEMTILGENITRMPIDQLALFQLLSTGIERAVSHGDLDDLERAVTEIIQSYKDDPAKSNFAHPDIGPFATDILYRWNDRTISTDAGLPFGLK